MTDGTTIICYNCGHERETTEPNPTLVDCKNCGSWEVGYK